MVEPLALKCDLRDDRTVRERLARYGRRTVQYEEGLAVARRIRASRYLGASRLPKALALIHMMDLLCISECSSKHNRGVSEVFYEAARVSLGTRSKSGEGCVLM
jgi:Rho family, other